MVLTANKNAAPAIPRISPPLFRPHHDPRRHDDECKTRTKRSAGSTGIGYKSQSRQKPGDIAENQLYIHGFGCNLLFTLRLLTSQSLDLKLSSHNLNTINNAEVSLINRMKADAPASAPAYSPIRILTEHLNKGTFRGKAKIQTQTYRAVRS